VPYLKLAAVHDEQSDGLTLFALNRNAKEQMSVRVNAVGFAELEIDQALQLRDPDLNAVNSKAQPDRVQPTRLTSVRAQRGALEATLAPASWNVIRAKAR
jgi:alpha-N-arabinofuranosidase